VLALFLPPSGPPSRQIERRQSDKPRRGTLFIVAMRTISFALAFAFTCSFAWWVTDQAEKCDTTVGKWFDRAQTAVLNKQSKCSICNSGLLDLRDGCVHPPLFP
jgi:hypothetical protein